MTTQRSLRDCFLQSKQRFAAEHIAKERLMSKNSRMLQFLTMYQTFTSVKPLEYFERRPQFSDFDGLTVEEAQQSLRFIIETIEAIRNTDALSEISWNAFQSLQNAIQSLHNTYQQLVAAQDQGAWQSYAQSIDVMAFQLRQCGLSTIAISESQLQRLHIELTSERDRLVLTRTEVERLRDEVRTLITPAVAGSLSQAFTARRESLFRGRVVWSAVSAVVAVASVWTTIVVVSKIADAMSASVSNGGTVATIAWGAAIVRAAVLLPLFAMFAFAFSQYRRERELEEEYAHKAAVATSLPNYGDLAREASVRDQIVSGATTVIFTSPLGFTRQGDSSGKTLEDATKLIEAFAKLSARK